MAKIRAGGGGFVNKDDTRRMEDETRRMELKLEMLRKSLEGGDSSASKPQRGTRWKAADSKKPLTRGYVSQVLQPTLPPQSCKASAAYPRPQMAVPVAALVSESPPPAPVAAKVVTESQGPSLLHGEYNEAEAAASFQEAVLAWRRQGPSKSEASEQKAQPSQPSRTTSGSRPPAQAAARSAATGTESEGPSLLHGAYNEAEAAASFKEAVMAWRRQAPSSKGEGEEDEASSEQKAQPLEQARPGSFWSSLGGAEVDLVRASTPLRAPTELAAAAVAESQTQHGPPAVSSPSEEKLCCYQCYKQFYSKYAVERQSPLPQANSQTKRLCSEACADAWLAAMQAKAENFKKRQEKLGRLEEVQRIIDEEKQRAADVGAGSSSGAENQGGPESREAPSQPP